MHKKYAQMKPAKLKKTLHGKRLEPGSTIISKPNDLEAKRKRYGVRTRLELKKLSLFSSLSIFLDWEQFVFVPLLCKTWIWKPGHLQRKNFQSIKS